MLFQKLRLKFNLKYHDWYINWNSSPRFKYGVYLLLSCCVFAGAGGSLYGLYQHWNYVNHITAVQSNPQYQQLLTEKHFAKHIAPAVQRVSKTRYHNVLPSITIAQAGIESNWGQSKLYTRDNNPFGVKGSYRGHYVPYKTSEVKNGRTEKIVADFRKYPNLTTAIKDHNYLLYSQFLGNQKSNNYKIDARLLVKNHYATDPAYATKIIQVIQRLHLSQYDN